MRSSSKLLAAVFVLALLDATTAHAACPKIWLIGDSQTVRYGNGGDGALGLIARHPEWCITNFGLGGETSDHALTRIGDYLSEHPLERADVAIVLYGENDRVRAYLETITNDPACQTQMLSCPLSTSSFWHPDETNDRILELAMELKPRVGEILLGLPIEGAVVPHTPELEATWQAYRWLKTWALGLRKGLLATDHHTVNFRLKKAAEFVAGDPFHQSGLGIEKNVRKAARGISRSLSRQGVS